MPLYGAMPCRLTLLCAHDMLRQLRAARALVVIYATAPPYMRTYALRDT